MLRKLTHFVIFLYINCIYFFRSKTLSILLTTAPSVTSKYDEDHFFISISGMNIKIYIPDMYSHKTLLILECGTQSLFFFSPLHFTVHMFIALFFYTTNQTLSFKKISPHLERNKLSVTLWKHR